MADQIVAAAPSPLWVAEVRRRIAISEGRRNRLYSDTLGVATIGIGFNCQRSDAEPALSRCGVVDVAGVLCGASELTDAQVDALFEYSFGPILSEATASVANFARLSPARQFVVVDLIYNLGAQGWHGFTTTRSLISAATATNIPSTAHTLFGEAADHLECSAWFSQVGNRARRNVAMVRSSAWVDAQGDGSQ